MKRVWAWLRDYALIIAVMFVASLVTTGKVKAQGKLPPIVVPQGWSKWNALEPDMREYAQPFYYEGWWLEIGKCEGVIVPLELTRAVHFVFVNAKYMIVDRDPGVLGFADSPNFTVYLVLPLISTKAVVMHEMLHMLDYWNGIDEGKNYHPPEKFERCGITTFYPNYNP